MNFIEIMQVYEGSDGGATRALYDQLANYGPAGVVAMNLFRACKASERAKKYRGGGYRGMAYEKKDWSIGNLCEALRAHGTSLGIVWGWGRDEGTIGFEDVLYIELPAGQCSFHNGRRCAECPDYTKSWDGVRLQAPTRICTWIKDILNNHEEGQAA